MVKKTKIKKRPRRLFKDEKTDRYFYLIDGKKKYIKTSNITSDKQIARINIKNIIPVKVIRKTVRPRSSVKPITNQQIVSKLVPISAVSANLTDKLSLYKGKDELEKKITKLEEGLKVTDTKAEEIKKAKEQKGFFKNLFKPTKAPKATSGNTLQNAINMLNQRAEDDKILKQQLQAQADADRNAVNTGMVTTNQPADEEDEGDVGSKTFLGKLNLFKRAPKKHVKIQDYLDTSRLESYSAYPEFPPHAWFIDEFTKLSGYKNATLPVYNQARELYMRNNPQPQPANTTRIEDITGEESKGEAEIPIGFATTGRVLGRGIKKFMHNMYGSGEYENDDDGIYNNELEEIFQDKMHKFLPVIPADKMHTLIDLVDKDTKKIGWIQNTQTSDSMGRHWVAYFIDIPNMEINYYDSLVENDGEPPMYALKGLKKIIDKIHPEYYLLFKYSQIRQQNFSTKNCGYFALKFIMDRYRNVPFKTATGYDTLYPNNSDDEDEDEDVIDNSEEGEKMIKRFKRYL